ncbi:CocE/NonD family hydrolase [Nocardioides aurantiacus]|uniref:ABC-2 type transport system ATP-binding protein n=1 Tax=Nocardioides aurantiacus TaxID=86796 RepID=A0A3N2CPD9_9ACTN|nr:CocE/NonD family hydrolase [Nocardioides aurantiacus]ROR89390.1 ABC-2 type transport system ATP-binding protein [Nocardioides aurantiacus]
MSRSRRIAALALASLTALTGLAGGVGAASPARAAESVDQRFDVLERHFALEVGPGNEPCDVVGDLYVPEGATSSTRAPAILTTNGFGGSKDDQAGLATLFAKRGYVVLSYSGLGFGGSGCEITLDDPAYDGDAAAQLIDYLGGADGIAFTGEEHTEAQAVAPLDVVAQDGPGDPRVGMVGGSYGGQVQYAAASVTDKLDTIIPLITWNDLSYSLGPNNTDQVALPGQERVGVSTDTPGSVKTNWALGFSAIGLTGDVQNQQDPIPRGCPNFADFVCPALVNGAASGALDDASVQALRRASVASYVDDVTIPTLILQGQADTLFNLNEAIATYRELEAQGTPVKMSWTEYGHSGDPAPGEIDFEDPDYESQHITRRIVDWFDHYLKQDDSAPTGPEFSYFRDWIDYDPTDSAAGAYGSAPSYPVGSTSTYHLSSTPTSALTGGSLVTDRGDVTAGREAFVAPGGPLSAAEQLDVISSLFEQPEELEPRAEEPGTSARYDTARLTRAVDVVGSPQVRLQVRAPSAQATQGEDTGKLVLYLKVADVAPDGTSTVVRNLAAPVRVEDVTKPFTVTVPAFAHRFDRGHRIRLLVAGASPNYRGNTAPVPVSVTTAAGEDSTEPLPLQSLTLPTTSGGVPSSGAGSTPDTGAPGGGTDGPGSGGNGSGNGSGSGSGGNTGDGSGGGSGNGSGNGADSDGGAQAAPAPGTTTTGTTTSALPDTGGPRWDLLAGGLALLLLGAGQVLIGRRPTA